jgi:hypothetical protein
MFHHHDHERGAADQRAGACLQDRPPMMAINPSTTPMMLRISMD